MTAALTKQGEQVRSRILAYIAQHHAEKGYPPTVREIGAAVGLSSSSTVHAHLRRLVRQGKITHDPTSPRTIQVAGGASAVVAVLAGVDPPATLPAMVRVPVDDLRQTLDHLDDGARLAGGEPCQASFVERLRRVLATVEG